MTAPVPEGDPVTQGIPDLVGIGVQALLDNANRLGLTWKMSLATVNNTSPIMATLDGDTTSINMTSIIGENLVVGDRVYVMSVPPAANFIMGEVNPGRLGKGVGIDYNLADGSTTSATPVPVPGVPAVAITKRYADTWLHFVFTCTFFATGADAGAAFSANVPADGIDIEVGRLDTLNGALNTRQQCAGQAVAALPAGYYVFEGYWYRSSGTGTLFINTDDVWTMSVEEYWP